MKLRYDLPEADRLAYEAAAGPEETLMYCLPYTIHEDRFVKGFLVVTDQHFYKLLDGEVLMTIPVAGSDDFRVEAMYGNCGFYVRTNGTSRLVCQFVAGRHLARYSVLVRACEILAEQHSKTPIENDLPERFCPKCGHPYVHNTTICPNCLDKGVIYRRLWALTKGFRFALCMPFLMNIVAIIISFVVPWIEGMAVNNYLNPLDGQTKGPTTGFLLIVLVIVATDLFNRVLGVAYSRAQAVFSHRFTTTVRQILFEKVTGLSLSSIQRRSTGEMIGRISNDVPAMQNFMLNQLPSIFSQIVSFIVALIVVLIVEPMVCLFILVPTPFAIFMVRRFWKLMERRNQRGWMLQNKVNRQLQDIFNGIRVVKNFGQEKNEIERFRRRSQASADQSEANEKLFDTFFPFVNFTLQIGNYLILLFGNLMLFRGKMSVGLLYQLSAYANLLYGPLLNMSSFPRQFSAFLTSAAKIFEILEETPEVGDIDLPIDIRMEGEIKVKNVTFGYDSYNPVLNNVSVEIKPGEMIGIVGHSGSGKSTLINLIMRLYDVDSGAVEIDDVNIKDISQEALRSQMGVVLQETFLFAGTVRDNIAYACPHATDDMVIAAARLANAHDFIMDLPDAYNTWVGAGGHSLSGGERQRIAIARAVIHDPRILILDEATAALDTETEKLIQDALKKLTHNRTTLAIAHRLSTLRNADRLLVLDHGRVAEFGTHNELLEQKGIYYKLVMAQQKLGAMPKIEEPPKAEAEAAKA